MDGQKALRLIQQHQASRRNVEQTGSLAHNQVRERIPVQLRAYRGTCLLEQL